MEDEFASPNTNSLMTHTIIHCGLGKWQSLYLKAYNVCLVRDNLAMCPTELGGMP